MVFINSNYIKKNINTVSTMVGITILCIIFFILGVFVPESKTSKTVIYILGGVLTVVLCGFYINLRLHKRKVDLFADAEEAVGLAGVAGGAGDKFVGNGGLNPTI